MSATGAFDPASCARLRVAAIRQPLDEPRVDAGTVLPVDHRRRRGLSVGAEYVQPGSERMGQDPAAAALQSYLHEHIPLSEAMRVQVVDVQTTTVVLRAPLAPNINHRETAFGGSVSALAILSAWSLLHTRLHAEDVDCQLVIQRNTMDYDLPIAGTFSATAALSDPEDWPRFICMLARKGRSRITVASVLEFEERSVGRFSGEFVAIGRGPRTPA